MLIYSMSVTLQLDSMNAMLPSGEAAWSNAFVPIHLCPGWCLSGVFLLPSNAEPVLMPDYAVF
jgi:hypothetical protein